MRGRQLITPPGKLTRPTSDRAREAIFSTLESQAAVAGARVWDLFAGSGALGVEALSRGALHATLVDNSRPAAEAARANLAALGYGRDRAAVVLADVVGWVRDQRRRILRPFTGPSTKGLGEKVDLVLADPPYTWDGWDGLLAELVPWAPLVVLQSGRDIAQPEGWHVLRRRHYGTTVVTLARLVQGGEEE
jgi:16S rRNA (guanine966-N2)-methyltransferase